jgi:hypothetical protein
MRRAPDVPAIGRAPAIGQCGAPRPQFGDRRRGPALAVNANSRRN